MNPRFKWLLKGAVACGLLGWLLARADLVALWRLLSSQAPIGILAAIALQWFGIVVATAKWWLLLPAQSFGPLFRLNMAAQFYSLVIPGQVGAEAFKAYQLGRGRADAQAIAASVLFDKLTCLIALLVLGVGGASMTNLPVGDAARLSLVGLLVVGFGVLVGLRFEALSLFVEGRLTHFGQRFPKFEQLSSQMVLFVNAWCAYTRQPVALWGSLAVGLVQEAIYISIVVVLARSLGLDIPILEWCWIFALVSMAAVLPISLAGVGVREGAFVGILAAFAIPVEQALAVSLSIFALHLLLGLIGGCLEFVRLSRK
ncbi:MAG: lysylphosphatidylglycerol synthase transmembrane domain-containing protein [Sulfuritalea sp.]|nr:lysylphosphatidylglycerol synthase transmembrane domain-containing protein [Sulfuritalea sp.]